MRFDVAIAALNPDLKVLVPAREWGMSREETIAYGERFGIPSPVKKSSPYSIDRNLLGRSIEAGPLEDPWTEALEEVFELTKAIADTPNEPEYVEIGFEKGIPVSLNGEMLNPIELITQLNKKAGDHGFGRLDMMENRLVGIKSREIYEAPALLVLIHAHRDLESLTYSNLVYNGLWYSPLKGALDAFVSQTQERVSGTVRVKLFKGNAMIVGRQSSKTLYTPELATYGSDDKFDHKAAEGFIYVWGLPTRVWSQNLRG